MTTPVRGSVRRDGEDDWGNVVLSGDPDNGPYIIRSQWDGRVIRVCGEMVSGKHVIWWTFDEAQMRPVCELCFPQWRHEQTRGR